MAAAASASESERMTYQIQERTEVNADKAVSGCRRGGRAPDARLFAGRRLSACGGEKRRREAAPSKKHDVTLDPLSPTDHTATAPEVELELEASIASVL